MPEENAVKILLFIFCLTFSCIGLATTKPKPLPLDERVSFITKDCPAEEFILDFYEVSKWRIVKDKKLELPNNVSIVESSGTLRSILDQFADQHDVKWTRTRPGVIRISKR